MLDRLYPVQLDAVEKLSRLRVGALYIERQEGKLRTVLELVGRRARRGSIEGVLWLCTRRRRERILEGVDRYAPGAAALIEVVGIESLSHNLALFTQLMERARRGPLMLVIDNGLLIKNVNALRTRRVLALSQLCPYRLLVSDVPFTRQVSDMFAQWYALDWRILGYRTYWGFCINHILSNGRARGADYLARAIAPYCAQILREDVQPVAGRKEYVWRFRLPPEAMEEYQKVAERFIWKAMQSATGVYRMLQACQHVTSGRRVIEDYPLKTQPMYDDPEQDPRLGALLSCIGQMEDMRLLILYRYSHERDTIYQALCARFGGENVALYPGKAGQGESRFTVMNVLTDEREARRLNAQAVIHYSGDWDWRKRQEKELQCQGALEDGRLMVVSLVAADTIDMRIVECVWRKDSLVGLLRGEMERLKKQATER